MELRNTIKIAADNWLKLSSSLSFSMKFFLAGQTGGRNEFNSYLRLITRFKSLVLTCFYTGLSIKHSYVTPFSREKERKRGKTPR